MAVDLATNFSQFTLTGASIGNPTSIQFGPDGRLYVAQQNGLIKIFTIERTGTGYHVTSSETITLVKSLPNHNDDGSLNSGITDRQVTGIIVTGTATDPVIYVGSSDPRIAGSYDSNLDTNSGIVSRLTINSGGEWEKIDLIRGLPRSEENHSVNGMQYDAATNELYVAVGGNTNMGAPSNSFGYLPEYAYSAAILKVDLDAIDQMSVKVDASSGTPQSYVYDLPTLNDPTRADATETVFGGNDGLNMAKLTADSPVQIYSPGFRNPYDMVRAENGKLYVMDNGPNKGWGNVPQVGPNGITNQANNGGVTANDTLHIAGEGYYGGHPNPIRANGSAAGLTESDGDNSDGVNDGALQPASQLPVDFNEVVYTTNPKEAVYKHPGGDAPALWTNGQSTNGITEYTASTFNGEMKGDLLTTGYGGTLYWLQMSADGNMVEAVNTLSMGGTPLDVTARGDGQSFAGTIWVAKYGSDAITILEPSSAHTPPPNTDDDADGILNPIDRFGLDPTNGAGTALFAGDTLRWSLSAADPDRPGPATNLFGLGFTGLMVDWSTPYSSLYDIENLTPGGAAGVFTIDEVGGGTSTGAINTQREAFQFGIAPDASATIFTIRAKMDNPFDGIAHPVDDQSQGIYLGTGDQDNYLKIVVHSNGGAGGIDVILENGGIVTSTMYAAPGLIDAGQNDGVVLSLEVNAQQGFVTPIWSYTRNDGATTVQGRGDAVQLSGDILAALQGYYLVDSQPSSLAVGLISTSAGEGTTFTATWDSIEIIAPANTIIAATPADLVDQGTAGQDIVIYSGSEDITSLPAPIDDVNLSSNANNVKVVGNGLDNIFTAGSGINSFTGGTGADTFRGVAAKISGDTITDFFTGDKIVIEGVGAGASIASYSLDTQILMIDADGDGVANTSIRLAGSAHAQGTSLSDFKSVIADGVMTISYEPKAGTVIAAVNSGGNGYTDSDTGITYSTDTGQYANGGSKFTTSQTIENTDDQALYSSQRYSSGDLIYNIPVAAGDYIVTLQFADIYTGTNAVGARVFDVRAEGALILDDLDVYAKVGGYTAYSWTGTIQADDGALTLEFLKGAANNPMVSSILVQSAGTAPLPGSATFAASPNNSNINYSTYSANTFQLTNTGQKDIVSVTIDTSTNGLHGVVFDPAGTAGDTATKNLKIDSAGGTGAVQPANTDYSNFSGGHDGGYDKMTVYFNPASNDGFDPGETVKFSVDMDPLDIKNSGVDGDAGSISGLELTGSTVTVVYSDGTSQTSRIIGDGSVAGGKAALSDAIAPAPTLSLGGQSAGNVAVASAAQTVQVTGAANTTVKVLLMTADSGNNVQPTDLFDANKASAVAYRTVVLDGSGHGSFTVNLPPEDPVYMTAAVDNGGPAGSGLTSPTLVVAWDSNTKVYTGTSASESFTAPAGSHWIVNGLAGNDTLTTGAGNDQVTGGAGNDTISTGEGDDVIFYSGTNNGTDTVNGGGGNDRIEALADGTVIALASFAGIEGITGGAWSGVRLVGGGNPENWDFTNIALSGIGVIDTGAGNDMVTGTAGADVIAGGTGNDILRGAGGDDVFQVAGTTGVDQFFGGDGFDRIVAVGSNALINGLGLNSIEQISGTGFTGTTIVGSSGSDTLDLSGIALVDIGGIDGGAGNDSIVATTGGDTIIGGGGNDIMVALDGDDSFLIGTSSGTDSFEGGSGFDRVIATAANAVIGISHIAGVEQISSGGFSGVTVAGTSGNDRLDLTGTALLGIGSINGGGGNDSIVGSTGDDTLLGGVGDDELAGGAGLDHLTGGDGADLFVLDAPTAGSADQIVDFALGSDKIVVRGSDYGLTIGNGVNSAGALDAAWFVQGNAATAAHGQFLYAGSTGVLKWDADGTGVGTAATIATLAAGTALQASGIMARVTGAPPPDDVAPPTAAGGAGDVTSATPNHVVTVTYSDGGAGVDASTIDITDLAISGPTAITVLQVSQTTGAGGAIVASYTLGSPDGFTSADNGSYGISLVAGSVADLAHNGVAGVLLDNFLVDIGGSSGAIQGTSANDMLSGTAGNDVIEGLAGNDTLDGLAGSDTLYGGMGNDTYIIDVSTDTVVESALQGADLVKAYASYVLPDNVEDLKFYGGSPFDGTGNDLNNRMTGAAGADHLDGKAGNDILNGGGGADILTGGMGSDMFDFDLVSDSRGTAIDSIGDFVQGQDRIDLSGIDANSTLSGNQAFTFIGSAAFSGAAGEARFDTSIAGTTRIFVNVDANSTADMEIHIAGSVTLVGADLVL